MSVPSIRFLNLQPAVAAKPEPAPVTTTVAQRVFNARPVNAIIFRFMSIPHQDKMKGVSRSCLVAAELVQKEKIEEAIPNDDLWKQIGGIHALRGVHIRNFPAPIQRPLSDYPARCMAGFEQRDGEFLLYRFQRCESIRHPCLPCLPDWVQWRKSTVIGLDAAQRYLEEDEPVCCKFTGLSEGPGCLSVTRFFAKVFFECCCFKSGASTKFGWLTTFYENGGVAGAPVRSSRIPEEDDEIPDLEQAGSKDKQV